MVALFEAVMDGLGDDLGLVAVDAVSGELLGDGERIEHAWQPTTRPGAAKRSIPGAGPPRNH